MKQLLIIFNFFFVITGYATVEFHRGSLMKTDKIQGEVTIHCRGEQSSLNTYTCKSNDLAGGNYGQIIVKDEIIEADWLQLQREGSQEIKGTRFDARTGKTKRSFNLWIKTVLQEPLLKFGKNKILYTFSKRRKVVKKGFFFVQVENGDFRQCRNSSATYYDTCPNIYTACDDYFYRQTYCE